MWKIGAMAAAAAACALQAHAEDQVRVAPPAAWVQPGAPLKTDAPDDGAAVRFLLMDHQLHFGAEGLTSFAETAVRVQTPQGLQAMSTLTVPWDPALGSLTVHKLQILRGGEVIDLLAKQTFTVLRRESNLEAQELDGVLTAVLQPEDLRVGDVVNMAFSISSKDPALAGHVQWAVAAPNVAIDVLRLRAGSDQTPILWRATEGIDGLKPGVTGQGRSVEVSMNNVQPLLLPADAPRRFQWGRMLQFSDFKSWAEVSAVMQPLYAKAATIAPGSPLQAEVARIKAASADPKTRAEAALALVQDQVRYVALAMDDGGYVPADAGLTWKRRFGDCKGKTVLLMALLKAMDIDAQPALVASTFGDGVDQRLPSPGAFDHVLVRATIGGRVYWLDGTRLGDRRLDSIRTPAFFWALPVQAAAAALVRLAPSPLDRPATVRSLKLDASAGLDMPAQAHAEQVFRGDDAFALNAGIANMTPAQREAALRKFWSDSFSIMTVTKATATYDPAANEERLVADGTAKMAWDPGSTCCRLYEPDGYGMGWKADFTRPAGPHADAPFAVNFPTYEQNLETIILPNKGQGFTIQGGDIERRIGAWSFRRKMKIEDGVFTLDASTQSLAPEFVPAESDAKDLTDMSKVAVYVIAPSNYKMTKEELDQYEAKTLTTADQYYKRGETLRQQRRFEPARSDLQKAVLIAPKDFRAFAGLAELMAQIGDMGGARETLAKAVALAPGEDYVNRVGAFVAEADGDYGQATAFLTKLLDKAPNDRGLRLQRARVYQTLRDAPRALADTDALVRADPKDSSVRQLRADVLLRAGRGDDALAEADSFIASAPEKTYPHRLRGQVLERLGRTSEAQAEFDKALALNKTAAGYATRANDRPLNAYAARLADIAEALKLEPGNDNALQGRAIVEAQAGEFDKALAHIQALVDKAPDDQSRRSVRAYIYARAGKPDLAATDVEWMRARTENVAGAWNAICFDQAMWNLTLDKALADCNRAIALAPRSAAILDSRAFVLFRLGRLDEALKDYDLALKLAPTQAASLYGRGLARLGKGQIKDGQTDLAEARGLDARIDDTFAEYGVTPPAAYASSNSATK